MILSPSRARSRSSARTLPPRAIGQITLLFVCLIWGANFSVMSLLLKRLAPLDVAMARTSIAALGFVAILLLMRRGRPRFAPAEWTRLLLLGLLGVAVVNVASSLGQRVLPASIASLLMTSSPIFTALFAAGLGMERIDRRMVAALTLATGGLFILAAWGRGTALALTTQTLIAVALLLLVPVCWAAYTVLSKPMLTRHPPLEMAAYGMIIGSVLLLPLAIIDPHRIGRIAAIGGDRWALLLFSAIGSLVVGFIAFSRALQVLSASEAAMSTYLTPVIGVLIAWAVLGEQPTPGLLAGGVLIVAAMALVTTRRPASPVAVESPPEAG